MYSNELQWISTDSNELQLELIGGNCMDKIAMVKKEIQLQNWSDKELAMQESGLTAKEITWHGCLQN